MCRSLSGVLRGILPDGFSVWKGLKMADIDPRKEQVENCTTISIKHAVLLVSRSYFTFA